MHSMTIRPGRAGQLLLMLALGGCAGGPSLPTVTGSLPRASLLTPDEERMDCAGLTADLATKVGEIKSLRAERDKEQSQPAPTLLRAYTRVFGDTGNDGTLASDRIAERQRVIEALNARLVETKCSAVEAGASPAHTH
jgi:hypothetical protein